MKEEDVAEQVDKLLASGSVSWLFGAGISKSAGVPLMAALTERVMHLAGASQHKAIVDAIVSELPEKSHVEHYLTFLADHIAIAERSAAKTSTLGDEKVGHAELVQAHEAILAWIAEAVRWGYIPGDPPIIGSRGNLLISIDEHLKFAQVLFVTTLAGVAERRGPVKIFTTNYDTLIEDALALSGVSYWDGFDGGAVAFRSYHFGAPEPKSGLQAHVVKLHGSIDWHIDRGAKIWRVRDGDQYPDAERKVVIYPQATKYVATQKDPFASQFDMFRRQLTASGGHVLATCGYSFGDDHINDEIASALSRGDSDTALVAFVLEVDGLPPCLDDWRKSLWGERIYVLTQRGVYVGSEGPFLAQAAGERDWWTFSRLSDVLRDGLKEFI